MENSHVDVERHEEVNDKLNDLVVVIARSKRIEHVYGVHAVGANH